MITRPMKQPMIAVCGVDGAGKSSLLTRLKADPDFAQHRLIQKSESRNFDSLIDLPGIAPSTREDFRSGPYVRLNAYACLFDFLEHYRRLIEPALIEERRPVLLDRYIPCWIAYANIGGCQDDVAAALAGLPSPAGVIWVDANQDTIAARMKLKKEVSHTTDLFRAGYERAFEHAAYAWTRFDNNGEIEDTYPAFKALVQLHLTRATADSETHGVRDQLDLSNRVSGPSPSLT